LFVPSVAISLVAGEQFLRAYERRLRERPLVADALSIYEPNPGGSIRLRPNLDLTTHAGPYTVRVRTNRQGMRWRELPERKPAGTIRIAFYGDSFTFGCWADAVENSLVGVFERHVAKRFEALNFGVPGYGVEDSALRLEETALRFAPDYAILVLFDGNDFSDTYLGLDRFNVVGGTAQIDEGRFAQRVPPEFQRPDFVRSTPTAVNSQARRVLQKFALFRFLAPFLGLEQRGLELRPSRRFTSYTFWSRIPPPEIALRARDATLGAISRMSAFATARGIRFGIVTVPYRDQVYSVRPAGVDFDIDYPQIYVQVFAREHGIPYLDLLPILRAHVAARGADVYLSSDLHFNNLGHELSGKAIADWFRCCLKARDEGGDGEDVSPPPEEPRAGEGA
jgi:lysophospholipase L1-like esterase